MIIRLFSDEAGNVVGWSNDKTERPPYDHIDVDVATPSIAFQQTKGSTIVDGKWVWRNGEVQP